MQDSLCSRCAPYMILPRGALLTYILPNTILLLNDVKIVRYDTIMLKGRKTLNQAKLCFYKSTRIIITLNKYS